MVNYYKVLELPDDADWSRIRHNYKHLRMLDSSPTDGSKIDHDLVETAYQVLSSPEQRRDYNKRLHLLSPSPEPERPTGDPASASTYTGQSDDEVMRDVDFEADVDEELEHMARAKRVKRSSR
ncbi:MAG: hypothetical protein Q9182_003667 [Xanthomendoza sp. 2 TL-2023]